MARASITRDSGGRITSYHAKEAPSQNRLKAILSEARQQRAKQVGVVVDVKNFQAYEMKEGEQRQIWATRGKAPSPEQLRQKIPGGKESAGDWLINLVKQATGAEHVSGLNGFNLNFVH